MANLKITLVKSTIGAVPKHKLTVEALGLKKVNKSVVLPDNAATRGMVTPGVDCSAEYDTDDHSTAVFRFNNNVTAKRDSKGAGEITIRFNNDKEIEEFLQALENSNI